MKMRSFGWHCSGLCSLILDVKYRRTSDEWRSGNKEAQMELFVLTTEERERCLKFAKNLRWFTDAEEKRHKEDRDAYWKEYRDIEYSGYDFYLLFDGEKDEDIVAAAEALERIGNGETLEDPKPLMDYLHKLGARAEARTDDEGCF